MNNKIIVISGTDYNINGIQELGELKDSSSAEVVEFNKFGYVGIRVNGKDEIVKRHLSDCEDIRSMTIGSELRNLTFKDGRWVVLHNGIEIPSKDVYVIKFYDQCGNDIYISRSTVDGRATNDITKAWFTFIEDQAVRYANKKSIMNMRAYSAINVESAIKLEHYEY